MSTRLSCLLFLLLPAAAQAETYTVWEDTGIIYGRAESTGVVTRLSQWDGGARDPYVDHHFAVWVDARIHGADIYGYTFDQWTGTKDFAVRISPDSQSDPVVSWGGNDRFDYWFAWREAGGIWANYVKPPMNNHAAFEVVPDYAGPFSLNGNVLSYDGGQVAMDPPPPPIPEPGTLVMLLVGMVCVIWPSRNRAG